MAERTSSERPQRAVGEAEQEAAAAAEAARIGGSIADDGDDPAMRPVREAGGGEAEGFEDAEDLLIEHASHGDQQSAHVILHDAGAGESAATRRIDGEADHEHSSEYDEDEEDLYGLDLDDLQDDDGYPEDDEDA